jgi:hypothetical protein
MSYNSELHLFRAIEGTYLESQIERSVYNRRRRKLFDYFEKIRQRFSSKFSDLRQCFIVDSTPIEICKFVRAGRSNICATADVQPAFGYCAAKRMRYFCYKLHLVSDDNTVVHSFDLTPANVHDVNYLQDVKYNLQNCELIGDKGYISAFYQTDLFNHSNIKLVVPSRKNQKEQVYFSNEKRKKRRRIETLISQLHGQFAININFAKTFQGLITRILSKITTITIIQYLNCFVYKKRRCYLKIVLRYFLLFLYFLIYTFYNLITQIFFNNSFGFKHPDSNRQNLPIRSFIVSKYLLCVMCFRIYHQTRSTGLRSGEYAGK